MWQKLHQCLILLVLFLLIINITGCKHEGEITMSLHEAIETGKTELRKIGYPFRNKELLVEADDNNTKWNNHIKSSPLVLENEIVKRMNLEENKYWAIYFSPKKTTVLGGDAFVFIDRSNGKVMGVLFGE